MKCDLQLSTFELRQHVRNIVSLVSYAYDHPLTIPSGESIETLVKYAIDRAVELDKRKVSIFCKNNENN